MKKIALLWFFLFTLPLWAQTKPAALKFDEFSDFPSETVSPLYDRTNRFGKRMKIEPASKKAVIIFYNQRKGKYPLDGGTAWAERALDTLNYSYNVPKDRIYLIGGGYREFATLEFWIVPKDAEMPKPTPTFSEDEIVYCPEINIAGDGFRRTREQPLK